MRIINPMLSAGNQSIDPEKARSQSDKFFQSGHSARTEVVKFRLFHGDKPTSSVVECRPMEANAWNKNAAAFYAWQCSLGRELLPLLEWKRENDRTENPMFLVRYSENGKEKSRQVYGASAAEAKREFLSLSCVAARVISIERVDEEES